MSYDNHCHTAVGKLFHNIQNLTDHLGVKCGCRLVEKHYFGVHGKSANNGDTLFLTARQLLREGLCFILESDSVKKLKRFRLSFFFCLFKKLDRSEGYVIENIEIVKQIELLKNHANSAAGKVYIDFVIVIELFHKSVVLTALMLFKKILCLNLFYDFKLYILVAASTAA